MVEVKKRGKELHVWGKVEIARMGAEIVPLPERCKVLGVERDIIHPSEGGKFYVTLGTIDPYHLILDLTPEDLA